MAIGALIDTNNRLLGWSTNDFSLYGGQTAVTIGAPPTAPRISDGLSVSAPASVSRSADPEVARAHEEAMATDSAAPHDAAPSAFHFTPFAPSPIQFGDLTHAGAFEAAFPAAPGTGASAMPMEAFHLPSAVPTSFTPTLAVEQPDTYEPLPLSVNGLAAPVLGLDAALDHVISSFAATTDNLLGETQQLVDVLPNVSDLVFDSSPVTALDGFLGSDPVGGVATLVSMVDSADAFDLSHTGLDIPQVAASGSILDFSPADESIAGPLLGDVAHGVDAVIPDHHHDDGVLGLS